MRTASIPTTRESSSSLSARAQTLWPSLLAGACLGLIALLACHPSVRSNAGDRAALLFLAVASALWAYTPLRHVWNRSADAEVGGEAPEDDAGARNAAITAVLACACVLYPLARRFAPPIPDDNGGLALRMAGIEQAFPISYAALVAVGGAILVVVPTWRACSGLTRAVALALATIAIFAWASFRLLAPFYPVGATEVIDPTPLIHVGTQVVEFGALAILCHASVAHATVRRWILRLLPLVLLAVWALHQFMTPPEVEEE